MHFHFWLAMSSGNASNKRARALQLISLGRRSYASHTSIEKLLAHVSEHGVPDTYDRNAQLRARREVVRTSYDYLGSLVVDLDVPLVRGGSTKIAFQNPLACFAYQCKHSLHYAKIVQTALEKRPSSPTSPWKIVLYQDGVDPSDMGAKNHSRNTAVFYWSFAEFGALQLGREEVWFTICVCRKTEYHQLLGGVGALFDKVLSLFFGEKHDLLRSGLSIEFIDGKRGRIFARANVLLGDIPAIKDCTDCKGHAGMICCPKCLNATQHNAEKSIPMHELTTVAVSIAIADLKAFTALTRETLHDAIRKINAAYTEWKAERMSGEQFTRLTTIYGWNHSHANVILNERYQLDMPEMLMYDWAHIYVHDGLADVEFGYCMKWLQQTQSTYTEFGRYVSQFTFPKSAPQVKHLFAEERYKNYYKTWNFSCTGSEFLTLAPVMHRYFENIVKKRGEYLDQVNSVLAVLEVVMVLLAIKTGTVSVDRLNAAVVRHLVLFHVAWGEELVRPKHHYALHLGPMLSHFGFLLATFTHERKHRLVTRYCRDRRKLASWDTGVIEEITCHQVWQLSLPFLQACSTGTARGRVLIPLGEIYPGVHQNHFTILSAIDCNGGSCSPGDVITFLQDGEVRIGQLLLSVGVKGRDHSDSFIARWKRAGPLSVGSKWCTYNISGDDVIKVRTECIDTVLLWQLAADAASCAVYLPLEIRPVEPA